MQLSSLIGKPILSPAGENYGYVTAARPVKDLTKLSCLVAADGEEEEIFIPARAILSLGDAVITGRARLSSPTGVEPPIGKEIYAYTGEYLGTVCDLLLGDGAEAILVITKEGVRTTAAASCAIFGEHIVLYLDKQSRDNAIRGSGKRKTGEKSPPRPRTTAQKRTIREELAPAEEGQAAPPIPEKTDIDRPPVSPIETKKEAPMPESPPLEANTIRLLGRTDLLGRIVKKSICDDYGVVVARAGERITPAVLARARRANRLLALTVSTLTVL